MDLAKYRSLFLEEGADCLVEMSRALLVLEKDPACADAIDRVFRAAHSVKSMSASLGLDAITEIAHRLEDRMDAYRTEGRVDTPAGIGLLFRGLEGLERLVALVRETGEAPPHLPELACALATGPPPRPPAEARPAARPTPGEPEKKGLPSP